MTDFTKHMTNEQRLITAEARVNAEGLARECFELALRAQEASRIALPATNEAGEAVLFGCLTRMYNIRDAFVHAGNELIRCLPLEVERALEREFFDRGLNIHKM